MDSSMEVVSQAELPPQAAAADTSNSNSEVGLAT
ncbi:hypothetical protein NPIL_198881, partial [Nephila pilipes]